MDSDPDLVEATAAFFGVTSSLRISAVAPGGCCNRVMACGSAGAEPSSYLRIYSDSSQERISYERGLLLKLARRQPSQPTTCLRFPRFLPSVQAGGTHVRLRSGRHACLFERIDGNLPPATPEGARAVGNAAAIVMNLLAALPRDTALGDRVGAAAPDLGQALPNPQFRYLWRAHPALGGSRGRFFSAVSSLSSPAANSTVTESKQAERVPSFSSELQFLLGEVEATEASLATGWGRGGLHALEGFLPEQVIHGDLHCGNVLVLPATIQASGPSSSVGTDPALHVSFRPSGVLDWEFATHDWRLLDPVISVSKYLGELSCPPKLPVQVSGEEDEPHSHGAAGAAPVNPSSKNGEVSIGTYAEARVRALLDGWMDGYTGSGGSLLPIEADLFPDLLVLRHVVAFIYFVGRVLARQDPWTAVTGRVAIYAYRIRWIKGNRAWLQSLAGRAVPIPRCTLPSSSDACSKSSAPAWPEGHNAGEPSSHVHAAGVAVAGLSGAHSPRCEPCFLDPSGLASLVRRGTGYEIFMLDLWGTTHDGATLCPGVLQLCRELQQAGKGLIFLGNSPNAAAYGVDSLTSKGLPRDTFIDVVTSGVQFVQMMTAAAGARQITTGAGFHASLGRRVFHYGRGGSGTVVQELEGAGVVASVPTLEDADFVLLSKPPTDDDTVEGSMPFLEAALARGLPVVCTNADNRALSGGREVVCGGALARRYDAMGGRTFLHGKPDPSLYALAHAAAEAALGRAVPKARILMVGDALETDVRGANGYGVDSLLVLTGIHGRDFPVGRDVPLAAAVEDSAGEGGPGVNAADKAVLAKLCDRFCAAPTYWARTLEMG